MAEKQKTFSILPKIINGSIAGFIGVACVFPLDLIKTRIQNQTIGPKGEKMYDGILDAFRKTYRKEGYFGMYRGSFINLLLVMPDKAIRLASNDLFRYHLSRDGKLPLHRQVIAGGACGICQLVITNPMELIKIQMQDQGRIMKATGKAGLTTSQVITNIIQNHGLLGFYKGARATLLREIPFCVLYFPMFANLNESCPKQKDGDSTFWCTFLSGVVAGAIGALLVTPGDVIKTRLQTLEKGEGEEYYEGIVDAFQKIWKKEGWRAFFKGGACRVMVVAPLYGIIQVVYYIGIGEFLLGIEKHT